MKKTKNIDFSHFGAKVKNILGSDSSVSNSQKSAKAKKYVLENTKPGDTKLWFFQVFSSKKIKFETERPSQVFWSILTGGAFFFPNEEWAQPDTKMYRNLTETGSNSHSYPDEVVSS